MGPYERCLQSFDCIDIWLTSNMHVSRSISKCMYERNGKVDLRLWVGRFMSSYFYARDCQYISFCDGVVDLEILLPLM